MATFTYPDMTAIGENRAIQGTSQKDEIIILGDVLAEDLGNNLIDSGRGNDTLIIGGSLIGREGFNTIALGQGDNFIQVNGILSEEGGANKISSGSENDRTQIMVGAGGIHSLSDGTTRVEVNGKLDMTVTGEVWASDYGYSDFYLEGNGDRNLNFAGNILTERDGVITLTVHSGSQDVNTVQIGEDLTSRSGGIFELVSSGAMRDVLSISGDLKAIGGTNSFYYENSPDGMLSMTVGGTVRSSENGLNEVISTLGSHFLTLDGGMLADGGSNRFTLGNADSVNTLILRDAMRSINQGSNEIVLDGQQHLISLAGMEAIPQNGIAWQNTTINHLKINSGDTNLLMQGAMQSTQGGLNTITVGEGEHTLTLNGGIRTNQGNNEIHVNDADSLSLIVENGVSTSDGVTWVYTTNVDTLSIHISGGARTENYAQYAHFVDGVDNATIYMEGDIVSEQGMFILALTPRETGSDYQIHIDGGLFAYNDTGIELTSTNNIVVFNRENHAPSSTAITINNTNGYAMYAEGYGSSNYIDTHNSSVPSYSNDQIVINGSIHADIVPTTEHQPLHPGNQIITGLGNDHLVLNGKVTEGALRVRLGEAPLHHTTGEPDYDVLSLKALNAAQFTNNYQEWLADLSVPNPVGSAFHRMYVDSIRVDIGRPTSSALDSLGWLDDLVTFHNTESGNISPVFGGSKHVALELYIDQVGRSIDLGSLFSTERDDMFSGLDMSGNHANTLRIDGTLADNNMDGDFLRILGDTQDSVRLSGDWTLAASDYIDVTGLSYNVYHNQGDELLIQSTLNIV